MKKIKFFLIALLPITIASCQKTEDSTTPITSSPKNSSEEIISSEQESLKASSSQEKAKTPFEVFKDTTYEMFTLNKLGLAGKNNSYHLSSSGTTSVKSGTTSQTSPFYEDTTISKGSLSLNVEGLTKAKKPDDIHASLKIGGDFDIKYSNTSKTEATSTIQAESVELSAYLNNNTAYLNLNNEGLKSLLSQITIEENNLNSLLSGKYYYKVSNVLPSTEETTYPLLSLTKEDINNVLDNFDEDSASGIISFTKNDSSYLLSIQFTNTMLTLLPPLYQMYLKSENPDLTDEELKAKVKPIEDLCKCTKINTFNIALSYDEEGYQSLEANIDIEIKNYTYADTSDELSVSTTIDSLKFTDHSHYDFLYNSDVNIAKPTNEKDYSEIPLN